MKTFFFEHSLSTLC